MNRLRSWASAAALPTLSGVLYFLSWVGFGIWPLSLVAFLPLVWALKETTPRQALRRGAWMGFVTHLGGYTWIVHLLTVFAFLPLPLAVLGYLLICAAQGFLFGVFAFLLRLSWLRLRWPLTLLLPLCLVAVEFVYPLLFQSYTGVALIPRLELMQIADLGGPLLTTALVAIANGALADVIFGSPARRTAALGALALAFGTSGAYGRYRIARSDQLEREAPRRRVGLAQPNVGEVELHNNPNASVHALWNETAELHSRSADLVIWPEVGFNAGLVDVSRPGIGRIIDHGIPVSLVAGVERAEGKDRWNSAVLISKDGRFGDHYDKIQLLAFGEYIPLGDTFPILYQWSPMASHLSRGASTAPLTDGPWRYATIICYEDILPGIVNATMRDRGQGRPHAIVNLTNDSWYGAGHEQEQHLMLAAMRAIEHHRWLLRATSTGISAFVDASGRVVQRLERNREGVLLREVPMLQGTSFYEIAGDWPGFASIAVLLAGFGVARLRSRKAASA